MILGGEIVVISLVLSYLCEMLVFSKQRFFVNSFDMFISHCEFSSSQRDVRVDK